MVVALASSTYSGTIANLRMEFPGYDTTVYIAGLSVFVLGFAVVSSLAHCSWFDSPLTQLPQGPLFWAPLSEVFGRRNLFIVSYVLFTCFNAGLIGSQNITTIISAFSRQRISAFPDVTHTLTLQSFDSSLEPVGQVRLPTLAARLVTSSTPNNVELRWRSSRRPLSSVLHSAVSPSACKPCPTYLLISAFAAIIGGFLGQAAGFRWVFALIAILTAILTVVGALWVSSFLQRALRLELTFAQIPETYAPVLLRQRAQRLSKITGKVYRSAYEKDKPIVLGELFKTSLTRPWALLFMEPIVILLTIYMAISEYLFTSH